MKKVGLYFGSFNPIHVGHLIIANFMATRTDLDQVWFVVSPQSPFKKNDILVDQNHRLKMVQLATRDNERFVVEDIEFGLPKPNYTADTLSALARNHPNLSFSIIMGEDNLIDLHHWKDYRKIIDLYPIFVYPRNLLDDSGIRITGNNLPEELEGAKVTICDAPLLMISSTFVRDSITNNKDVRYLIPETVIQYISNNFFYE